MDTQQIRLIIKGIVQGVSFRMSAQEQANRLGLKGWVRNCRDGTVEMLLQGFTPEIDDMIKWAYQGPPSAQVTEIKRVDEPLGRLFRMFDIQETV